MKLTVYSVLIALVSVAGLSAQEDGSHIAFQAGAGFTDGVGRTGSHLDPGWNISTGAGYNFSPRFGALIDVTENDIGVNSATLGRIGAPEGRINLLTATLDPIIHFNPHGHVDFYVTGGGGLFHSMQTFSQTRGNTPFGFTASSFGDYTVNKPGVDAGIGIEMGTKWHGKLYAEARYERMFNSDFHNDYLPVTFGFRW